MQSTVKRLLYSRADAAAALSCSPPTIYRLEKMGKLKPVKLTSALGNTYYDSAQVEALARGKATPRVRRQANA